MKNTYSWKHLGLFPVLYGVFINTSLKHCSRVCYLFWTWYNTVLLGSQEHAWGQTGPQKITLTESKWFIWFIPDLWSIHDGFSWTRNTADRGWGSSQLMQQSACHSPSHIFFIMPLEDVNTHIFTMSEIFWRIIVLSFSSPATRISNTNPLR